MPAPATAPASAPAEPRVPVASEAAEAACAAADLSARELDAVRSVLAGMTAQDAAAKMGVSASAVSSYRQRAYAKLGVAGARELRERLGDPEGAAGDEDAAAIEAHRSTLLELGLSETEASVLALVAAQLAGLALGSRLGARVRLPRWLVPVAATVLALYVAVVALMPTGLLPHELLLRLSSLAADGLLPVMLSLVAGLALGLCAGARLRGRGARP